MGSSSESAEEIVFSLMSCKLRVIQLVKAIKSKKSNLSEMVEKILMRVERLEELKYIMNILFRISSIVALQKIDHIKLA
jgi:transcription termination factor NusB